jgi:integrase
MTTLEQIVNNSRRLSKSTIRTYRRSIEAFLDYAGRDPAAWTPQTVAAWQTQMLADGLAPQSINAYLAALRYASRRFAQLGHGPDFAGAIEKLPSREVATPTALDLDEVRALLGTCGDDTPPDLRDRAMILLGIHCGFRRAELCSIEFGSVQRGVVTVIAKGNREHSVRASAEARDALNRWKAWLRRAGIDSGPLFRGLREQIDGWTVADTALSPDGFAKMLARRGEAAGLGHVTPHQLRHTCTSLLLAAGVPAWKVKLVLGHKSDTMIARYTHDTTHEAAGDALPVLDPWG